MTTAEDILLELVVRIEFMYECDLIDPRECPYDTVELFNLLARAYKELYSETPAAIQKRLHGLLDRTPVKVPMKYQFRPGGKVA